MKAIKVLVVDDHRLVREGIASLLNLKEEVCICGTAENGREGVKKALQERPDVVLMDIRMPEQDGISAVKSLREKGFSGKVIMLTTFDDDEYIVKSLKAGAAGYLMKDLPLNDLCRAIIQVHTGTYQLDSGVVKKLLEQLSGFPAGIGQDRDDPLPEMLAALSSREKEILRLIAQGAGNREIAEELRLSEGTIKNYVSGILNALGLRDRTNAALTAIRYGFDKADS